MKMKTALIVLLAFVAFVASGCGMVQSLTGRNAGTVSTLWSDVPPLPNATKQNIDIPLPVQLVVQGFIQAANADSSNDTKLDKFDFIAYQTPSTPQQVADFYTPASMTAAGWNAKDTPGCTAGASSGGTAGFCVFGKQGDAGKQTILMIVPVSDDSNKQTQVFYIRFEATNKTVTP